MLDIHMIREEPERIAGALRTKNVIVNMDKILTLDQQYRELSKDTDDLKHLRNTVTQDINDKKKKGFDAQDEILKMRDVSSRIKENDQRLLDLQQELRDLLITLPNIPHETSPVGKNEKDNVEIRHWGSLREFTFKPKNHLELGEALKLFDFQRAAKISGSGFPLYTGKGAKLERALINFMLDLHTQEHGYTEILPPFLVNSNSSTGTGQLPKMADDMYYLDQDDLWLIPTAEVPVTNIHRDEILNRDDLPVKYTAYSGCFRREAGSYGKDTRGFQRLHQFNKVEMVQFCHPDESYSVLEILVGHAETVLKKLELPYRVVELCTADLSFAAAKCYDLELWAPGEEKWLEVSSCSNFGDFQARRSNIRFKDEQGKNHFVHTLNGSGVATPRLLIAILENYQNDDGSVTIPEILIPYTGFDIIRRDS
ncbi:MAG TPA: serine--tRNA ligase [Candidatus Marinimicrobia bacterium]|nr:serine--tRNA ligase [Candidatus Neomarinimicrobiota bacterium]